MKLTKRFVGMRRIFGLDIQADAVTLGGEQDNCDARLYIPKVSVYVPHSCAAVTLLLATYMREDRASPVVRAYGYPKNMRVAVEISLPRFSQARLDALYEHLPRFDPIGLARTRPEDTFFLSFEHSTSAKERLKFFTDVQALLVRAKGEGRMKAHPLVKLYASPVVPGTDSTYIATVPIGSISPFAPGEDPRERSEVA